MACAGVSYTPSSRTLDEPAESDVLVKAGPSFDCDTRKVTVINPLDERIVVAVSCSCGEPVEYQIPPHHSGTVSVKGHKSLSGNNVCRFNWGFVGHTPSVIQKHQSSGTTDN